MSHKFKPGLYRTPIGDFDIYQNGKSWFYRFVGAEKVYGPFGTSREAYHIARFGDVW